MVNKSQIVVKSLSLIALMVLLLIMLFPFALITINSFKTQAEYYANGPFSLPQSLNWDSIGEMWGKMKYMNKLLNSFVISISAALLAIGLSLFNAFALGIGKVKGRALFLVFFILGITLPQEAVVYPLYYFFKLVGIYNTRLSVILIFAVLNSAFGTYLLTSVFGTFTQELIEAAMIDGCNKVRLLFSIVVPLSIPVLSVLFVFFFIWTWNAFFLPLIFLISSAKYTVPLAVALTEGEYNTVITTQSAGALLGIIPCILFFIIFQRTLTRGITLGSIK